VWQVILQRAPDAVWGDLGVSELHRISPPSGREAEADLIFVHGLGGDPVLTWCHDEDELRDSWPFWLAEELPGIAVHTLEYEASPSGWLGRAMPLIDRAKDVLTELETMAIGARPIVFVGHSLGGLLIKQLLREAIDKSVPGWRRIAEQTRAVVFLATPHAGADLATWLDRLGTLLRSSAAIDDLRAHNALLRNLNEWYRENAGRLGIATACFYEKYPLNGVMVVDETSADPGITGVVPRPLDADHASICKPPNRTHTLYDFLAQQIGGWTGERERPVPQPASAAPPAAVEVPPPSQLPAPVRDFQGRARQVEELLQALRGGALAAVCGMGGSGKTALALHVAHRLASECPDGLVFIELGGTSARPLSAVEAMGRVVLSFEPGARLPDAPDQVARLYRSVLAGKQVLMLLDDANDAAQVEPLLRWRAPTTRIMMTLREAPALAGVPRLELDCMSADEARALFRAILGTRQASDAELDLLAERCGHLPIALRVAGTFLAMHPNWTIAEYVASLSNEGERMELLRIEGAARLDVPAVLALSASDLAREQPALAGQWQQLAVFSGRFDTTAAAAVWNLPLNDARAALSELLRRAMIRYDPPTRRYHWNAFMRDVARRPLGAAGDVRARAALERCLASAALRHSAYYHWVLERSEQLYVLGGTATVEGLRMFDRDRHQIEAGHGFALAHAGGKTGARLLAAYGEAAPYLVNLRLRARERVAWTEAAVAACRRLGDREAEGSRLTSPGTPFADCDDPPAAIRCYERAVAIARELGDRQQESVRLGNLGSAYADLGQPRRAIGWFSDALVLARLCGDRRAEASHLGNLAAAYLALGRHRVALQCGRRALACAAEIGDRRGQGVYRANLASVHLCLDEFEPAVELYREALAIAEEIGDRRGQAYRLGNLALALDGHGDRAEAAGPARQALALLEELEEEPALQLRRLLLASFPPVPPPADAPPQGWMPEGDRRSS
jgi:tetratricopeptide (TPR) repeat protein